jgi:hypothetical protein
LHLMKGAYDFRVVSEQVSSRDAKGFNLGIGRRGLRSTCPEYLERPSSCCPLYRGMRLQLRGQSTALFSRVDQKSGPCAHCCIVSVMIHAIPRFGLACTRFLSPSKPRPLKQSIDEESGIASSLPSTICAERGARK